MRLLSDTRNRMYNTDNSAALPIQNAAAFICIVKQNKQTDGVAYSKAQTAKVEHGGSYTVHVVFPNCYRFQIC